MSIPWNDWQFWVVTAAAMLALIYVLREVIPVKRWPFKRKGKGKPTSLTIDGKSPRK
ncbi:hypothetical protein PHYC_00805 [Phycisphaerales bacterium]|nr:hypothetical protein PHYC_00805 [Phycisphaerales bacterium]